MKKQDVKVVELVFVGALAAMVYVVTLFRFPLLGSKVHFANAVCLLGGMLLGPWLGGIAAGLGSALYDAFNGYDLLNVLITFVSKFAMGWVCGALMHKGGKSRLRIDRTVLSAVAGALTYVALYMLKTWLFKTYVEPVPADTLPTVMVGKLIPSLINAAFAVVTAPIFFHAVRPALRAAGIMKQLEVK